MMRTVLVAAAFGFALSHAALAQDTMMCDDATMMKLQADVDAMTAADVKQDQSLAQQHLDIAKTAMTNGNSNECVLGMKEAMKYMKKKEN